MKQLATLLVLALGLAGCEGPAGPVGPAGPAGQPGPGTRITLNAVVSASGVASADLPAEAGSLQDPPALTCYLGEPGSTVFLVVGLDTYSEISCGLGQDAMGLYAGMVGAPPGWTARFVVVY